MKISNKLYIGLLGLSIFATSCDDDAMGDDPNATNTVQIEFDNRFGATDIELGTTKATNASGEEYTLSTLNYFISNVSLMSDMGEMVSFPDQYFLVKESDAGSQFIDLPEVPSGTYSHLTFTVGVDSLKSISDVAARTGVLDVASYGDDNMYWSWNMGYIFFKMEGTAPGIDNRGTENFAIHIGGFGGKDAVTPNNLKQIDLHLHDVSVSESSSPQLHVIFDVTKVMDGANTISLMETPAIHNPMVGTSVSANYVSGFALDHVH
ncbi:MbnP family protein [uncultured Arcticibacterium sp.]|uniref:MbnP family protein n=1 Tax=uncultured Arcticibacterium sp. TaxID=2173042 RepID=UPI0030F4C17B